MFSRIRQLFGAEKPRRQKRLQEQKEPARRNPPAKLPPLQSEQPHRNPNRLFEKGDRLGVWFHVYGVLGQGGFGTVLLVYDFQAKEVCALKTFRDELLASVKAREAFKNEASRWIDIGDHPFILTARSIEDISNRLFVKMDCIAPDKEGRVSLAHYLHGQAQPIELVQQLEWGIQFCLGMEHANQRGIRCHRDIKPQNILITENKSLKISDFGLALVAENSSVRNNSTGADGSVAKERLFGLSLVNAGGKNVCGTPGYIPPEIYRGESGDIRSDIYSFGLVLWQMTAHSPVPPFANYLEGSLDAYLRMIYETQIVAMAPPIPGPMQPIIAKCLAKDSSDRYQTFAELREKLETVLWREAGKSVEVPPKAQETLSSFYRRAVSLGNVGRLNEALAILDQALQIAPQDIRMGLFRSRCLFDLGRTSEALQNCDELLQANSDHIAPIFTKAILLDKLWRQQEALPLFEQALLRAPNHFEAWQGKFNCLMVLGRFDEALTCCERVLQLQPKAPASWAQKADALIWLNRYQEALSCADQALEFDPRYAKGWISKGIALSRIKQYQQATTCFEKALEIDPTLATAWAENGMIHLLSKRNAEAIICFDKALVLDSSFVDLWFRKGLAEEDLRHFSQAIVCFSKFLESACLQDAPVVPIARSHLQRLKAIIG